VDSRERVQTVLSGGVPDRVPFQDSYWQATIRRWRGEGLAADEDLGARFGFDIAQPGTVDDTLQLPARTLEASDRQRIQVDANGATRREMLDADGWVPSWLDFSIKGRDDWERLRDRAGFNATRIALGALDAYRAARRAGKFCAYTIHACFHPTWHKVGMETMLVWMHEDPQLVRDMFAAHTQLVIDGYDAMKALGVEYDGVFLPDDLAYRNGPLISPASGEPVSAILLLIRECPVLYINGWPPSRATSSNRIWLAFTSAMIVLPGCSARTSRDSKANS